MTLLPASAVFATGWGNTGFGVTLLLMPLLYKGFNLLWGPQIAWRAAFFVPAGLQLIAGMLVLVLTDDTPEGRLPMLKRSAQHPACTVYSFRVPCIRYLHAQSRLSAHSNVVQGLSIPSRLGQYLQGFKQYRVLCLVLPAVTGAGSASLVAVTAPAWQAGRQPC